MIVKDTGGEKKTFKLVSPGAHPARCFMLIDLGLQRTEYMGTELEREQLMLGFEIYDETTEDGKPLIMYSMRYTKSLSEKANLRAMLESWRGNNFTADELAGFDLSKVVGKACLLTIKHGKTSAGKEYANIVGISPMAKGMKAFEPINPTLIYEVGGDNFDKVPAWIQRIIDQRIKEEMPIPASDGIDPDETLF